VARELGHGDVHAEANAEVRDASFARDAAGEDLSFPPARPEAARDEDAVDLLQPRLRLLERHSLGVEPAHVHGAAVVDTRMVERLVDGQVGVLQLHVLADERDLHRPLAPADPLRQLQPFAQVSLLGREAELLADERVEALLLQGRGDQVEIGHVLIRDHRTGLDVGEERDLLPDVMRERPGRPRDDDVGVDTDPAQLVHRVLRGLRLQLARRIDERDERHVQVADVRRPGLAP